MHLRGSQQTRADSSVFNRLRAAWRMPIVRHWTHRRIRAHVSLIVLSRWLEPIAERVCEDTARNTLDDLKQTKLAQLFGRNGIVRQGTERGPCALKQLKSLKIPKPPPVFPVN